MGAALFRYGTQAEYDAIAAPDDDSVYWTSDTRDIIKGTVHYGTRTKWKASVFDMAGYATATPFVYDLPPSVLQVFDLVRNGQVLVDGVHYTVHYMDRTLETHLTPEFEVWHEPAGTLYLRTLGRR